MEGFAHIYYTVGNDYICSVAVGAGNDYLTVNDFILNSAFSNILSGVNSVAGAICDLLIPANEEVAFSGGFFRNDNSIAVAIDSLRDDVAVVILEDDGELSHARLGRFGFRLRRLTAEDCSIGQEIGVTFSAVIAILTVNIVSGAAIVPGCRKQFVIP